MRFWTIVLYSLTIGIAATPNLAAAQTSFTQVPPHAVHLQVDPVAQGSALWLPLSALKMLGVTATALPQRNAVYLQHHLGAQLVPDSALKLTARGLALPLASIEHALGLKTLKAGKHLYLIAEPAILQRAQATPSELSFEFSRFVPTETTQSGNDITLTFFNLDTPLTLSVQQALKDHEVLVGERFVSVKLSVADPNLITFDRVVRPGSFGLRASWQTSTPTAVVTPLPDGLEHQVLQTPTATGTSTVHLVLARAAATSFALRPLLPAGGIGTLAPLDEMANLPGVVAAINANFFDPTTKHPIGLLLHNNQLLQEDYAQRAALAVDTFGRLHFLNPSASASLNWQGEQISLSGLNRIPRKNELVAFTSEYGSDISLPGLSTVVRVADGRIASVVSASVFNPDGVSHYVIATGEQRDRLKQWQRRDTVDLLQTLTPAPQWPLKHAISAGPLLVHQSQIVLDAQAEQFSEKFAAARAARSVVALRADGTLMLAVVLQNSQSTGMTLAELAHWSLSQGAAHAMALDGGGSISLMVKSGARWQHWGGTRPIAVGLALFAR